jgi:hypothetical protein
MASELSKMQLAIFQVLALALVYVRCDASMPTTLVLQEEQPVTPKQARFLAEAQQMAVTASQKAESELIEAFKALEFREGLLAHGAFGLAALPAAELLEKVKTALASMEYTSNFGISAAYRHDHPGEPAMNFSTIDEYGRIPTMWELRALNSSLVAGTPDDEWKIMEAAETGLYQLPITISSKLPVGPNQTTAALERPQYLAGNIHSRADVGVPRYGVFAAVLRHDVVRQRAVMLSSDSGGWQNACNKSVKSIQKWFKILGPDLARCDGIHAGGQDRPVLGTKGHELHTILGNTVMFGKTGGHLSRLVWELLDSSAHVRRLETLMYTEAGLLGPLRPRDMKLLVASFPSVFGTPDAQVLRAFCARHGVPLAWALSSGESWDAEQIQKSTMPEWMPFSRFADPVGGARMLDPASWHLTNATAPTIATKIWAFIETEVMKRRNESAASGNQVITSAQFKGWWQTLDGSGGSVQPLRGAECASTDLCFGTYQKNDRVRDCVCRMPPAHFTITV